MRPIFAAAVVAGVGLLTIEASPTQALVISVGEPNGSTGTTKCVDVSGNSIVPAPVQVFDCHASGAQQFQWAGPDPQFESSVPPGTTIYTESGHDCLDIVGVGTTNGTPVQSFPCNGGINQQFIYFNGQIIAYANTAIARMKCLDAGNGTRTVGPNFTQLVIEDCNGTDAQQFQLK